MKSHYTIGVKFISPCFQSRIRRAAMTAGLFLSGIISASAININIDGSVKDDGDGGAISGFSVSSVLGNQLYVYLIDNSNTIVDRSLVSASTLTYSLVGQANINYAVCLSTNNYPINAINPTLGMPVSYVPTAEGASALGDGTPDYLVAINSSNNLNINFAIDARPTGFSYTIPLSSVAYDGLNRYIIPTGAFTGIDPEDGTYLPGFPGRKVDLYQAAGGQLYYNNSLITFSSAATTTRISNFDVSLLRFEPQPAATRHFAFSVIDDAGVPEAVPNSITFPTIVLPVSLASFNGSVQEMHNRLSWQTASEQACKEFIIERSDDGAYFRVLATVVSKSRNGNSSQPLNYDFVDYNANTAPHAPYYYRIRQTALDGDFNYSSIVRLTNSYTQAAQLQLAPNPSNGSVNIDMATGSAENTNVEIVVYNMMGALTQRRSFETAVGRLSTALDLSAAPAGTYYIQLRSGNAPAITKQLVLLPH